MPQMRFLVALWSAAALAACGARGNAVSAPASSPGLAAASAQPVSAGNPGGEAPLKAEANPPGDIPDSQVFVTYSSASGGFSIDVPEGWARSTHGQTVTFADKFDGLSVNVSTMPEALASIQAHARAGRDFTSRRLTLPAGSAIEISYTSNSSADPVTDKRVRLENAAVIVSRGSKHFALHLWAPLGADNVDQWERIERSLQLR